jgi:hypothetical protein
MEVVSYFDWMFRRLENRCFFTTTGDHIGLGPKNMQIGDLVCLFYGCRLPIVLREMSVENGRSLYSFVGPAYVDGAMSGEYAGEGPGALGGTHFLLI